MGSTNGMPKENYKKILTRCVESNFSLNLFCRKIHRTVIYYTIFFDTGINLLRICIMANTFTTDLADGRTGVLMIYRIPGPTWAIK